MDWLLQNWAYWFALSPAPWVFGDDEAVPVSSTIVGPHPELTVVDLWLIELTYEVVAAESHCTRCGAPLGRGLRVTRSTAEHSQWTVSIATRCGGWRRHRHVAIVGEASNDLALGPFHAK